MQKLFMITNSCGKIPQKLNETDPISADTIKEYFLTNGFSVTVMTYDELANSVSSMIREIKNAYFFCASSQYPDYFSSVEDVLITIEKCGGILIPGFIHYRAHENKYFQEIIKKKLNIQAPDSVILSSYPEGIETIEKLKFPVVGKLSSGYGSRSVELLSDKRSAELYIEKNMKGILKLRKNILKYIRYRKKLKGKHPLKAGKIILQEYISHPGFDWKILVFGNKVFYLKRYVKNNDFRASGSGNFDNTARPSDELIHFAFSVKEKLDTPWVSLDVIESDGSFFLIEYQCVHFGMYTAVNSDSYVEMTATGIKEKNGRTDIDLLFAEELYNYICEIENMKNKEKLTHD